MARSELSVPLLGKKKAAPSPAKFSPHKGFVTSLQLSICVAFWVTIFSLPLISPRVHHITFGDGRMIPVGVGEFAGSNVAVDEVPLCRPHDVGRLVNTAPKGKHPQLVKHDKATMGPWSVDSEIYPGVWCGYLPGMWAGYWPNVVVMIVFTVFQKTGSTVTLAWQGCMGTLCAVANISLMMCVFPDGARGHACTSEEQDSGLCTVGSMLHDSRYSEVVCWLDCVLVLFVFLISNSAANTIIFGMSWHVYFMMTFMNPGLGSCPGNIKTWIPGVEWDSEAITALLTSAVGALIAIMATLLPTPLLNITHVSDQASQVCKGMKQVWVSSLRYLCAKDVPAGVDVEPTPRRYKISTHINLLSGKVSKLNGSLSSSWWETFDLGRFKDIRMLYQHLSDTVTLLDDVMYALKTVVVGEDFTGCHKEFCKHLGDSMEALTESAGDLLTNLAIICDDGRVLQSDREYVRAAVAGVQKQQAEMSKEYAKFCEKMQKEGKELLSADLEDESILLFSLSVWAKRITDFAEKVGMHEGGMWNVKTLAGELRRACCETWSVDAMKEPSHVKFALTNLLSISICFVLGFYLEGNVFTRYSPTMASSLCLLISRYTGSSFQADLYRLLGVSLGSALPILVVAAVSFVDANSGVRLVVHCGAIFVYMFMFTYMYYSSPHWGSVGCCVAAFGCSTLLTGAANTEGHDLHRTLAANYMSIGQTTCAIVVQMVVHFSISHKEPRDLVVEQMETTVKTIRDSFGAFFADRFSGEQGGISACKSAFQKASALLPEADPSLAIYRDKKAPFRWDLCSSALANIRLLISDLSMLKLAVQDSDAEHEASPVLKIMNSKPAMTSIKADITRTLQESLQLLMDVVSQTEEGAVSGSVSALLEKGDGLLVDKAMDDLLAQLNQDKHEKVVVVKEKIKVVEEKGGRVEVEVEEKITVVEKEVEELHQADHSEDVSCDFRVRLAVAARALKNASSHLHSIVQLCVMEDVY